MSEGRHICSTSSWFASRPVAGNAAIRQQSYEDAPNLRGACSLVVDQAVGDVECWPVKVSLQRRRLESRW
jgi:hypothetical protein